jgi:hypothetical protein
LRVEGFSCSLGVLYRGLGISKWQFLIKKIKIKFPAVLFFNFRSSNPGSGSGIRTRNYKKCWIRIRIKSMRIQNPDANRFKNNGEMTAYLRILGAAILRPEKRQSLRVATQLKREFCEHGGVSSHGKSLGGRVLSQVFENGTQDCSHIS